MICLKSIFPTFQVSGAAFLCPFADSTTVQMLHREFAQASSSVKNTDLPSIRQQEAQHISPPTKRFRRPALVPKAAPQSSPWFGSRRELEAFLIFIFSTLPRSKPVDNACSEGHQAVVCLAESISWTVFPFLTQGPRSLEEAGVFRFDQPAWHCPGVQSVDRSALPCLAKLPVAARKSTAVVAIQKGPML